MALNNFPIQVTTVPNQDGFALNTPAVLDNNSTVTYIFSESQPAGRYSIVSSNNNYNYDMYLVTSNNQSAGYSDNNAIVATKPFDKIVIYAATANNTYTFTYKLLGVESASGTIADGLGPFVVSASPTTLPNVDSTTTVLGGNFASDVRAFFIAGDDTETEAKAVSRISSTEIVVTRPDDFPLGTYDLRVVNDSEVAPSRGTNKLVNYFDAGQIVQWVTESIPFFVSGAAYSEQLSATDPDGAAVTYSVETGSLPSGITLSSSGLLSGTSTDSGLLFPFTVRATDAGGYFADREFVLSRPRTLDIVTSSGTVNIPQNDTPFLIIGGGGAGGNGYFTTIGWRGGGSGYITTGTVGAGNYSLTIGAGGVGGTYNEATSNGGTTTFGSFTAAGGTKGRDGGAGGSAGGNWVGVVSDQEGADAATGFIDGEGNGGSGVRLPSLYRIFANSGQPLEMEGGRLIWDNTQSRPGASGGKFYSGGGGTKQTSGFAVAAAANTDGGYGLYGGGGGAGGGGASNTYTGPGNQRSGDGGNGILATLRLS